MARYGRPNGWPRRSRDDTRSPICWGCELLLDACRHDPVAAAEQIVFSDLRFKLVVRGEIIPELFPGQSGIVLPQWAVFHDWIVGHVIERFVGVVADGNVFGLPLLEIAEHSMTVILRRVVVVEPVIEDAVPR